MNVGPQYKLDDNFKALARLHQSRYRAEILAVDYDTYGNRLTEADAKALKNYYNKLNVHSELRNKYPNYSKERDADMLRSEHIPFNMFAPLKEQPELAVSVLHNAFNIECTQIERLEIEWAPEDQQNYLGDRTAFDVYLEIFDAHNNRIGIGVEVKYTENSYKIGKSEARKVENKNSTYWTVTRNSGAFINSVTKDIAKDDLRQIWRNHLLGLSMCLRGDIKDFVSITLHPAGNEHFINAIEDYNRFLSNTKKDRVRSCTFEKYIEAIEGNQSIMEWKSYLHRRYIVQ